jgi:hypothetical protein
MRGLKVFGGWAVVLGAVVVASACGDDARSTGGGPGRSPGSGGITGNGGEGASTGTGAPAGGSHGGDPLTELGGSPSAGDGGEDPELTQDSGGDDSIAPTSGQGGEGGRAGGGDGIAGSGGTDSTTLLTGVEIEANPNMTISCFVSWNTNVPASSEVDFGEGEYAFRIRDAAEVRQHRVLVIGMHAETRYRLRAVSESEAGAGSVEGTFTTGALPEGIPEASLTASDVTQAESGWTLTNVEFGRSAPAKVVMYDEQGLPVWYFIDGTHSDSRGDIATALAGEHVLVGPAIGEPAREVDLSGEVTWTGPAQSTQELQTHEFEKTPSGNYLFNIELDKAVQGEKTHIDDQLLEELSPDLGVVWSWKLFDHVPIAGAREELCHGNALSVEPAAGVVYYNCRFLGLFKLDRASGEILWRLGGRYDAESLGPGDFTFDPPESQFSDAHDPEIHADGSVLLYDNGGYKPSSNVEFHTRVVEYQLDETKHTATRTFEFPGDFPVDAWYRDSWYTPIWGDADRLANGNILVTAGMRSTSLSTRIFEITRQGEVVWELTFPPNYGSYRAERLAPPPLVEAL